MVTAADCETKNINWDRWERRVSGFLNALQGCALFDSNDVEQRRTRLDSFFNSQKGKPKIANAGLLNAGKSTLFNALCGEEELFATADARKTTAAQTKVITDYELVDTPGLDAEDGDTEKAFAVYRNSQIILFTHSVRIGELDALEVGFLEELRQLYADDELRKKSVIPVLTKCGSTEDKRSEVVDKVRRQWLQAMGVQPQVIFQVRAKTHLKGIDKNKPPLCEYSQIPALHKHIELVLEQVRSAREELAQRRINDELDGLRTRLRAAIATQKEKHETRVRIADRQVSQLQDDIDNFANHQRQVYRELYR